MTNFYISDSHFGHDNIRKFCPFSRKFQTADEMNEFMIEEWNSVVTDKDTVYHLGDFCFGRGQSLETAQSVFDRLNGHKNLILGNHDEYGRKLPWESVMPYRKINEGEHQVILFHYPIENWDRMYHGSYHFHGHVHSSTQPIGGPGEPFRYMKNRIDIGADNIGFKPLTFIQIKEICDARTG